MGYIVQSPAACTAEELAAFYNLLLQRGRVKQDNLPRRIKRARLLGFYYEQDRLAAIVALKRIRSNNVTKIFTYAGVPELAPYYNYEIGWAFVKETHRRQGLAYSLVQKLLTMSRAITSAGTENIFALVRTGNLPAIALLEKFTFKKTGRPYQGREACFVLYTLGV